MTPAAVARGGAVFAGAFLANLALASAIVALTGTAPRWGLHYAPGTLTEAGEVWLHNLRVLALPLGLAPLVAQAAPLRPVATALLVLFAAVNAIALSLPIAAYGARALEIVGPHAALELLALSAGAGVYVAAHAGGRLTLRVWLVTAAAAACVLAIAALVEVRVL